MNHTHPRIGQTRVPLRDLVETKLNEHWLTWSQKHPHLADAIDRTRLLDAAVERLRDDPAFVEALRQSDLDEHRLAEAAKLLDLADRWARRILPG